MGDEGEWERFGGLGPAAHMTPEARAGRGSGRRHEAERDGAAQRGCKAARGDLADHRAIRSRISAPSRAGAPSTIEADADAIEHAAEFGEDAVGAGEIARLAAALATAKLSPASTGETVSSRSWP